MKDIKLSEKIIKKVMSKAKIFANEKELKDAIVIDYIKNNPQDDIYNKAEDYAEFYLNGLARAVDWKDVAYDMEHTYGYNLNTPNSWDDFKKDLEGMNFIYLEKEEEYLYIV